MTSSVQLYWVNAIVYDEKSDKKPWLLSSYTGHLTLDDAKKALETTKQNQSLISAWIDDGCGNVFVHECYIDTFGTKR